MTQISTISSYTVFQTAEQPDRQNAAPCAIVSSQSGTAAPWYGMRILMETLATNALVWKETPASLRPLLASLFQKWCDYLTVQSCRQVSLAGATPAPHLVSILNTIADTIAGLTSDTGLTLVIPRIRAIDSETIWLLEPLLARMGSKLRLVIGCDLTGHNGIGEQAARRILASIGKVPGAFVTFTVDPGIGRRLWFNSDPDRMMHRTEVCEYETAA